MFVANKRENPTGILIYENDETQNKYIEIERGKFWKIHPGPSTEVIYITCASERENTENIIMLSASKARLLMNFLKMQLEIVEND